MRDTVALNRPKSVTETCCVLTPLTLAPHRHVSHARASGTDGTGKSQTLKIIKRFAYRPRAAAARHDSCRYPRRPAACDGGPRLSKKPIKPGATTIPGIRENAFRPYQSDRQKRGNKIPAGEKEWAVKTQSILAQRFSTAGFRSTMALDGRTVAVRFRADHAGRIRTIAKTPRRWRIELVQGQVSAAGG
jgi:hypothetical protein